MLSSPPHLATFLLLFALLLPLALWSKAPGVTMARPPLLLLPLCALVLLCSAAAARGALQEGSFGQNADHFDLYNSDTFAQRYFYTDEHSVCVGRWAGGGGGGGGRAERE